MIAHTDGATIVHCAAGKDRTGVVVAFALAEVGVTREEIVADYARSAERVRRRPPPGRAAAPTPGTWNRRRSTGTSPVRSPWSGCSTRWTRLHGGVPAWLRANGWTEQDAAALRHHLLDP